MPHVWRRVRVQLDAPPEIVGEAAQRALPVTAGPDGVLTGSLLDDGMLDATLRVDCRAENTGTAVLVSGGSDLRVPYFGVFVRFVIWLAANRVVIHAAARLRAEVAGDPAPPPPRRSVLLPPVAFTVEQATRLAAIAAVGALTNFAGSLLTQNGDAVTRSFGRTDAALGVALALVRVGVLVSLVASVFSDRFGRRRLILGCLVGVFAMNALTAAAPSFEVFTAAQVFTRALTNATLVVAAIAAVEEAPEGARAFAFSMFGLALGAGFGLSVALLPLADLGDGGWRVAFEISALGVLALPHLARNLHETRRFEHLPRRGFGWRRVFEPFDRRYGRRFVLLGLVALLANVFSAPSSQLTNRYLTRTHDFSNSQVALLRGATAGLPGVLGILLAGRLSETRGRRPVTIAGLVVAATFQATFFLGAGALLWIMPAISIVAAACAGLAVGTMDTELFPTEARGSSNGFLLVCGVAGAAIGLLAATRLEDLVGGLGPAIALCAVAPLAAALFVVPRLPETRARTLDDISPSEVRGDIP